MDVSQGWLWDGFGEESSDAANCGRGECGLVQAQRRGKADGPWSCPCASAMQKPTPEAETESEAKSDGEQEQEQEPEQEPEENEVRIGDG